MDFIHHTNNVIDRAPGPLPSETATTSGYDFLANSPEGLLQLKADGYLPVNSNPPAYNAATQRLVRSGVEIGDAVPPGASSVTAQWSVVDKTAAERELPAILQDSVNADRRARAKRLRKTKLYKAVTLLLQAQGIPS